MLTRFKYILAFFIMCFFWGSSWAAVKLGLETVPIFFSLGIRFTIAASLLGLIVKILHLNAPKDWNFWQLIIFLCATSFVVPTVLIYRAQEQVDSGLASILFAIFPFWVAILSHSFLPNEKLTILRFAGIIIGFIGVVVIFHGSFTKMSHTTIMGMIAIIIAAFIQALGLVGLRRYGGKTHPVLLIFWPVLFSAVLMFIISFFVENLSFISFNTNSVISIGYLSIFCTVIAFVINFWLVKYVEAVLLSLSAFIIPVIAVFVGIYIMGEKFTSSVFIGSSVVLAGTVFANIGDLINMYRRKS
ncbi:MAG: DMT family transporter [Bacteroidetes bacterium]|nr:DMT family transporter [Bacteroidota bacterium]